MKLIIKKLLSFKVIGKFLEKFLYPFSKAYQLVLRINKTHLSTSIIEITKLSQELKSIKSKLKENLVVRNGIFTGMIYYNSVAAGSAFYPKILGSYEKEIANIIKNLIKRDYEIIVDIGCAEGYYAVGFARLFRNKPTKIVAFDIDKSARSLCSLNAKTNSVKIEIKEFCDSKKLEKLCNKKYSLIFIDAEGYELKILNKNTINKLKHCDFLVESHDFININSTEYLINSFENTHNIKIIKSKDDISKAYEYKFSELENLHLKTKYELLREQRPTIMKWIYAESKSN